MTQRLETEIVARNNASRVYNKVTGDTRRLRKEMNAAGLASKRFSQNLGGSTWKRQVQQAGMQVSDFSVQVAGGQSAILAFTQNAPQFLQNFGAIGGVIAAAVTILGTFAYAASRAGEAVLSFQEQVEVTTGAFDEFIARMKTVDSESYGFFERQRVSLEATSQAAKDLFSLEQIRAARELGSLVKSLGSSPTEGGLLGISLRSDERKLADFLGVAQEVEKIIAPGGELSGAIGTMVTNPDIVNFQSALNSAFDAENIDEMLVSMLSVQNTFDQVLGSTEALNTEQLTFRSQLAETILQLRIMGAAEAANLDTTAKTKAAYEEYYRTVQASAQFQENAQEHTEK